MTLGMYARAPISLINILSSQTSHIHARTVAHTHTWEHTLIEPVFGNIVPLAFIRKISTPILILNLPINSLILLGLILDASIQKMFDESKIISRNILNQPRVVCISRYFCVWLWCFCLFWRERIYFVAFVYASCLDYTKFSLNDSK